MNAKLVWQATAEGILFTVVDSEGNKRPWTEWARLDLRSERDHRAHVAPILRRVEEGLADVTDPEHVRVPHDIVAGFDDAELQAVGLSPRMPYSIDIRSEGAIPDPSFRFKWNFVREDGSSVVGFQRTGVHVRSGSESYIIPTPMFSLVAAMDEFNQVPPDDLESRFLAWAEIKELVPEEAGVDDYLQNMRVATASSISLRPFLNDNGEPDVDPVVGHSVFGETEDSEEVSVVGHRESLPAARQSDFAKQFRRRGTVQPRYAVGAGWYLVLPENVHKALNVVHHAQNGTPEDRSRFLEKPLAFLKDALGDELEDQTVENLFWDEGYSERVREIGAWTPKVLPWLVTKRQQEWLPPEEVGLRIGDRLVRLDRKDVPELVTSVRKGLEEGLTAIEHKGETIPCSKAALESLKRLEREIRGPNKPVDPPKPTEPRQQIALLIKDNLDNVEYERTPRIAEKHYDRAVPNLKARLLPHQNEGLAWLQDHWSEGHPGALLSDDMGLGKTLQALAFLAWVQATAKVRRPFLVVAPTGLLKNWRDEHDLHLAGAGLGSVLAAYGSSLRSLRRTTGVKELKAGFPILDIHEMESSDWVLASYETVRDYQHSFGRLRWGAVVLDEVQKIKNPAAAMTDAAKALNGDFVLALTGTPVENRMADLWSVVDAVWPGRLGSLKEFVKRYESDTGSVTDDLGDLRKDLVERDKPSLMLRRLKEDHLEGLPEKRPQLLKREMPSAQADAYDEAVRRGRDRKTEPGGMLEALHALRQISMHPMLDGQYTDSESFISESARLALCFEVLDGIHERGEKALVFTESRAMQGTLSEILQRRYGLDSPPLLINGTVSGEKRKAKVDDFQGRPGFDTMILSPRAGGVGLTLTAANHVIHLSRWWNPAVEDQCTDRVFRIGQRKPVHIYYVLAVHPTYGSASFDVRLDELLARKRQLSRAVLAPPVFTKDETAQLFSQTVEQTSDA